MGRGFGYDPNTSFKKMLEGMKFTEEYQWPNPHYRCKKKDPDTRTICNCHHEPGTPCPVLK